MKAVLDTRFFIVNQSTPDERFQKWARITLEGFLKKNGIGIVPSIVLLEFYKTTMENLGKEVAEVRIDAIIKSGLQISNLNPTIAIEAAKLRCKYSELPTADAIIAATAIATGSDCVLTDDRHIKQIKETKTRWV